MKTAMISTLLAVGFVALAGCNNNRTVSTTTSRTEEAVVQKPSISLRGPGRDLLVGDTATFFVDSKNTYGRDARVKWSTTAGKLSTDKGDSVARVRFDETGVYTIKATLEVDGNPVQTEAVDVRVIAVK